MRVMKVNRWDWGWLWGLAAGAAVVVLIGAAFVVGRVSQSGEVGLIEALLTVTVEGGEAAPAGGDAVYYCPMHPEQTSADPSATCPICGMDLVLGEDDGHGDLPVLRVSERSRALMQVQVMPVQRREVQQTLRFVGKLEADERRLRDVVLRSPGYVERLAANYLWQWVNAGDVLAEVYSPEVQAAGRELLVAANRGEADRAVQAVRDRLMRLGVSEDAIQAMLESGEVPRTYELRSPIDGHVMALGGEQGVWLGEGQRLVQLMDSSVLWVQLEVYERDLSALMVGLPVTLSVQAYPGQAFEGRIAFVSPHIDAQTRTARVRVEVANDEHRLMPGMFARAQVQTTVGGGDVVAVGVVRLVGGVGPTHDMMEMGASEAQAERLVIPASAVLWTGEQAVVYVQDEQADEPTYEGRRVRLGERAGDWYVVREGLSEGELVVSHGAFLIDSELQIRGRASMMRPERWPDDADRTEQEPAN